MISINHLLIIEHFNLNFREYMQRVLKHSAQVLLEHVENGGTYTSGTVTTISIRYLIEFLHMEKEIVVVREWYPDCDVKSEYSAFPVRQVTCFITTKDRKLLLVSKDGQSWSITAGHYESEKDSGYIETAIREVYEESGLDISSYVNNIKKLGYYLIKEVDRKGSEVLDTYLQVRFFLPLGIESKKIVLGPVKEDLVKYARFFSIEDSMKLVKWLQNSDEWKVIKKLFKDSAQV